MSFTQFSPTCGPMPLPALSLWPGRQPYRPRLVGCRRGGGNRLWLPALAIHRLDVVYIALSPHHRFRTADPCVHAVRARQQSQSSTDPAGKDSATSSPILTEAGTSVMLSFQSRSLLLLADKSSGVTVRMELFRVTRDNAAISAATHSDDLGCRWVGLHTMRNR